MQCNEWYHRLDLSVDFIVNFGGFFFYRVEYDAYRMDLESRANGDAASTNSSEDTQKSYTKHKENYENLRSVVAVKMQFLDENRVI